MTPIEELMAAIEWHPIESAPASSDDLPAATHEGILEVSGHKLHCFKLSDGRTVISQEDVQKLLGLPPLTNTITRLRFD